MSTKTKTYGLMIIAAMLLVAMVFAGAASSESADADATELSLPQITELYITGIPLQITEGESPDLNLDVNANPPHSVIIQGISWSPDDITADESGRCTLSLYLTTNDAEFSNQMTVLINGKFIEPIYFADGTVLIQYSYQNGDIVSKSDSEDTSDLLETEMNTDIDSSDSQDADTVSSVVISGIPQTIIEGEKPVLSLSAVSPTADVRIYSWVWTPSSIIPDDDGICTLSLQLESDEEFSSDLVVEANGRILQTITQEDGSILALYKYEGEMIENNSNIDIPDAASIEQSSLEPSSILIHSSGSSVIEDGFTQLPLDETLTVIAEYIDEYGNASLSKEIVWSVSDEEVLALSKNDAYSATIYPISTGSATVTASLSEDDTVTESFEVTVYDSADLPLMASNGPMLASNAPLTASSPSAGTFIQVSFESANLTTKQDSYYAYARFSDGTTTWTDGGFIWTIENTSVLAQDSYDNGQYVYLCPRSVGETNINVTSVLYPELSTTVHVTVEETEITTIDISDTTISLGASRTYWADPRDQFGHSIDSEGVSWQIVNGDALTLTSTSSSSNSRYVTINPVKAGTSVIRATSKSNVSAYAEATITIAESTDLSINIWCYLSRWGSFSGDTLQLTTEATGKIAAELYDSHGSYSDEQITYTWNVTDGSDVISVTPDANYNYPGKYVTVTPLKSGTAKVTVSSTVSGQKVSKNITVTVADTVFSSVVLDDWSSERSLSGSDYGYTVYACDQFGNSIPNYLITIDVSGDSIQVSKTSVISEGYISVTTKNLGTSTITLKSGDIQKSYTTNVVNPEIRSIRIQNIPTGITPAVGEQYIYLDIKDQFGQYLSYNTILKGLYDLSWSSSDSQILQVTGSGSSARINAVDEGTVVVTATMTNKSDLSAVIDSCTIVVEPTEISSVYMYSSSSVSTLGTGSAYAYVRDQFGNDISDERIIWSVDKPEILTVSQTETSGGNGITLTPKMIGTVTLRATAKSDTSKYWEQKITIEETVLTSIDIWGSTQLTTSSSGDAYAYVRDQFGNDISDERIIWSVDNPDLLTLSQTETKCGYTIDLTPKGVGTVTLTATSKSNPALSSEKTIVIEAPVATSLSISGSTQLSTARTGSANAYVCDQFGYSIFSIPVTWSLDSGSDVVSYKVQSGNAHYVDITPLKAGTAVLRATSGEFNNTLTITVEETEIISIYLGGSTQLTTSSSGYAYAYVRDQFGSSLSNEKIIWSVDNPELLTLSQTETKGGYNIDLTPKGVGTVTLTATSKSNPALSSKKTIVIEDPVATSLSISGSTQLSTARTGYADAHVCDQFGNSISSIPVTWRLDSGSDVVSYKVQSGDAHYVDITPLKAGTAVLRATSGEFTNTLTITVEETEITSIDLWGSTQLTTSSSGYAYAYVNDQFGSSLSNEKIIWSVDNPELLTLSQTETKGGYNIDLTPKGVGTVTLTATSKSNPALSSEKTIVIEDSVATSLSLSGSTQLTTSNSGSAKAYVCDQFGYQISNIPVTWSLDSGSDVISYKVQSGNAHYVDITPLKAGTAVLRATSGEFTKNITITVEETEIASIYLYSSAQLTTSRTCNAYAYVYDQFGYDLSSEKIIWSVDNPELLTLSQTETKCGSTVTLTPKGIGTVTLTATSKSNPALSSKKTIVIEAPIATSLSISGSTQLSTASTGSANAYVCDQFGYSISNISVTWSLDSGSDVVSYKVRSGNAHYVDITPLKAGTAVLRATSGEFTENMTITVEETEITTISLDSPTQLTTSSSSSAWAYVSDQFGTYLSDERIIWSVDNPELLTLSQTETKCSYTIDLTPKGVGTVTLTATSKSNPALSSEKTIVIEDPVATSLSISGSTQLSTARTGYAYAYVRDQFEYQISSVPVTWSLDSGSDVVSYKIRSDNAHYVDITPLKAGTAVLRATSGEFTKNMTITVEETEISSIYLSSSTQLTTSSSDYAHAYVYDQFGAILLSEKIIWSVDNPDLLTLSQTETTGYRGVTLTPKGVGTVTLTVTSTSNPALSSEKTIVIEDPVATSIYLRLPDGISLNNTGYAYAYVRDQCDNSIAYIPLLWEPVNGDDTVACSLYLNDQYHESATLIPLKEGTTTVNVSAVTSSGILSETKTIRVEEERITGIDLYGSSQISTGNTGYAYAYVYDQFSSTLANKNIAWSIESGNEYISIQTEAANPGRLIISALKPGTAVIKASYGDISETMTVVITDTTVSQSSSSSSSSSRNSEWVTITGSNKIINNGTWYVSAVLYNSNTGKVSSEEPTWSIVSGADNLTIAVDPEKENRAIITPKRLGTAVIKAVINGISAEQTIEIIESTSEPSLEISSSSKISSMGSGQATAYVLVDHYNGNGGWSTSLNNAVVDWSVIEGSDVISLAPADDFYSNSVIITPKKTGTAVIKAEFAGMSTTSKIEISEADLALVLNGYSVFYLTKSEAYQMQVVDQFGIIVSTPAASWDILEGSDVFALTSSASGNQIAFVPLKAGSATIEFSTTDSPEQSQSFDFRVIDKKYPGEDPTPEEEEVKKIPAPTISPNGKTFDTSCTVTISSDYKDAKLYYTTADDVEESPSAQTIISTFTEYSDELNITESTTLHAAAIYVNEDQEIIVSKLSKAQFTKYVPDAEYSITVGDTVCGNISIPVTKAKAGDIIAVTFTADPDYKLSTWTITGDNSGNTQENKNSISSFVMWSEPVTISAVFKENEKPKADSIVISRLPDTLYTYDDTHDTGTLTATVYDQFGNKFADSVTWSSDSQAIKIDAASGAYSAQSTGSANITARSVSDSSVKETVVMIVYSPVAPQITNEIHSGELGETEFGVLDDDLITVSTTNTKYLYWDWDDGSNTMMATYGTSPTTVGHTFIKYGDLDIDVTPSNKYRAGDTKTFHVRVIHAVPTNLVITDGPKSVTQGETHTYTAYATSASYYEWRLNDTVVSGQTQSTASITFPDSGTATVSVKAFNSDGISSEAVTKTVNVAAAGGVLGDFGTLTTNPETPVVNELASFSIPAVENAVKYRWEFSTATYDTTAPAIQHALTSEDDVSINVIAYNSIGESTKHTYVLSKVGVKPTVTITASPESPEVYQTTVCTASCSAQDVIYTWYLDDVKITGVSSAEYQKKWTYDDVGTHTISVVVSNDYGSSSASTVITVTPKSGEAPEINGIHGQDIVKTGSSQKYFINVKSKDPCSVTWYLNDVIIGTESSSKNGNGKQFDIEHVFTETGSYKLEAEVTADNGITSPQTVSKLLDIEVVTNDDFSGANKDDTSKGKPQKSVKPQLVNNNSDENALSLVEGIVLDHDDLNNDGEPVHINVSKIADDDLRGFTNDMGKTDDVKLALDINPEGLKNKKDLTKNAVLTFKLSKEEIGNDPKKVSFFRYDTGSAEQGWKILTFAEDPYEDETGMFWVYSVLTSGFSQITGIYTGTELSVETPVTPTPTPSYSSSSRQSGGSYILPEGEVAPTVAPTAKPTTFVNPTAKATTQATTQPTQSSPVPLGGLIVGLGAAALVLARMRR